MRLGTFGFLTRTFDFLVYSADFAFIPPWFGFPPARESGLVLCFLGDLLRATYWGRRGGSHIYQCIQRIAGSMARHISAHKARRPVFQLMRCGGYLQLTLCLPVKSHAHTLVFAQCESVLGLIGNGLQALLGAANLIHPIRPNSSLALPGPRILASHHNNKTNQGT